MMQSQQIKLDEQNLLQGSKNRGIQDQETFDGQNLDQSTLNQIDDKKTLQTLQQGSQENVNYYQESCKLYIANVVLTSQIKELIQEKNEHLAKIADLEAKLKQSNATDDGYDEKKKRHRRTATEIQRLFKCPVQNCDRQYGSEGSLTQHVKLKHPQSYNSYAESREELDTIKSVHKEQNDNDFIQKDFSKLNSTFQSNDVLNMNQQSDHKQNYLNSETGRIHPNHD